MLIPALLLLTEAVSFPSDYPTVALHRRLEGTSEVEVDVDGTGKVIDCRVLKSSGHQILDKATCKSVAKRATFTPAIGPDGKPTKSTIKVPPVEWKIPTNSL